MHLPLASILAAATLALLVTAPSANAAPLLPAKNSATEILTKDQAITASQYAGDLILEESSRECFTETRVKTCFAAWTFTSPLPLGLPLAPDNRVMLPLAPGVASVSTYPTAKAARAAFKARLAGLRQVASAEVLSDRSGSFTVANWGPTGNPNTTPTQLVESVILSGRTIVKGICSDAWKDRDLATAESCSTGIAKAQLAKSAGR